LAIWIVDDIAVSDQAAASWYLPGPVLTGAQAFAFYRLQELFGEKVRAALR